jgi:hypothetical protein
MVPPLHWLSGYQPETKPLITPPFGPIGLEEFCTSIRAFSILMMWLVSLCIYRVAIEMLQFKLRTSRVLNSQARLSQIETGFLVPWLSMLQSPTPLLSQI